MTEQTLPIDSPLPSSQFATQPDTRSGSFDQWQESISTVFDVSPLDERPPSNFHASVNSYLMGPLLCGRTNFDKQRFSRNQQHIRRDDLDLYLVQLYSEGGYIGQTPDRELIVRPGSISVLDLTQPVETLAACSQTIPVLVPRALLDAALPHRLHLHGTVLTPDTALGRILAHHLTTLAESAPQLSQKDALPVALATIQLIAASLQPTRETIQHARPALDGAMLNSVRRFIDQNLGREDLNVSLLCKQFHISRSHLYRLFEPFGGISQHILKRRLAAAHTRLESGKTMRIGLLAQELGISSESQFSRAFRRAYGFSPRELLERALHSAKPAVDEGEDKPAPVFIDWLRSLHPNAGF